MPIYSIDPEPTIEEVNNMLRLRNAELEKQLVELSASLENEQLLRKRLEWRISQLLREKYQPSSEKISVEQLEMILEGLKGGTEEAPATDALIEILAKPEVEIPAKPKKTYPSKKKRFALPQLSESFVKGEGGSFNRAASILSVNSARVGT